MSASASMLRSALLALTLSAAATAAVAQETVHFTSLDGTTNLTAYLRRPEGDAPRPALVLMHGCSGRFNRNGRIFPLDQAWMRAVVQGYVALTVDSASPRGFGHTCTAGPERATMWRDRSKDAFAALQYLQARPFVRADRVGLMGWSQGGGVVLLSINDKSIGRPSALAHDFRAAVSFYPAVCSERLQSRPYTRVDPHSWTTLVPLLVLFGQADNWTLFPPCEAFIAAARARGNPVELKSYAMAMHAFDAPNLPRTELPAYRTGDGRIPLIGTDKEARADAFARVLEFLRLHLEAN